MREPPNQGPTFGLVALEAIRCARVPQKRTGRRVRPQKPKRNFRIGRPRGESVVRRVPEIAVTQVYFLPSESRAPMEGRRICSWCATSPLDQFHSGSSASSKVALWCWEGEGELAAISASPPSTQRVMVRSIGTRGSKSSGNRRSKFRFSMCHKDREHSGRLERWDHAPVIASSRTPFLVAQRIYTAGQKRAIPYLPWALHDLACSRHSIANACGLSLAGLSLARGLDAADHWRKAGIGAIHVAGWHYARAECRVRRIFAPVDRGLPPPGAIYRYRVAGTAARRRRTQDERHRLAGRPPSPGIQLDWRKLVDNPDCAAAVSLGVRNAIGGPLRLGWRESGDCTSVARRRREPGPFHAEPECFAMNFQSLYNFDPIGLFKSRSRTTSGSGCFLDYRADLAPWQEKWIHCRAIRSFRYQASLDLFSLPGWTVNFVQMLISSVPTLRVLLLESDAFLIWGCRFLESGSSTLSQSPHRYVPLHHAYQSPRDQYQRKSDAIETSIRRNQQTGVERFGWCVARANLVASHSVFLPAREFVSSLRRSAIARLGGNSRTRRNRVDLSWLPIPAGVGAVAGSGIGQRLWPVRSDTMACRPGSDVERAAPAGSAPENDALRMVDFNGDLKSAGMITDGLHFPYASAARALCLYKRAAAQAGNRRRSGLQAQRVWRQFVLTLPR